MKNSKKLLIVSLVLIIAVAFITFFVDSAALLTPENPKGKAIYYTKIVIDGVKSNSEQRYEYTLDAYSDIGKIKSLTFTSSKQLRQGAYLELYVAPFRGVTYWHEVQLIKLPDRIKSVYSK